MATYLLDFDGTFFRYGTMEPIEGAVEFVRELKQKGHHVVFLTARCRIHNSPPNLTIEKTEQALAKLGVEYDDIICDVDSPRILINDDGAMAIEHPFNAALTTACLSNNNISTSVLIDRVYCALATIAWVAWKFDDADDADDYVQTMIIAKSLLDCNGFDHADIVARYRAKPDCGFTNNAVLLPGGVSNHYKGQISKLLASDNPLYTATNGASDGAAMKITAAAAFYVNDFTTLVNVIDKITLITHATIEARLSALLIALRLRRIFLHIEAENMNRLVEELTIAAQILGFGSNANFFLGRVKKARDIATKYTNPKKLLYQLCRHIGIKHLAWSAPVSACFWSYHNSKDLKKLFIQALPTNKYKVFLRQGINGRTLARYVFKQDVRHLQAIGNYQAFLASHAYHWKNSIDIDTFLSISLSISAAKNGIDSISSEVEQAIVMFGEDLSSISAKLVKKLDAENNQCH